MPACAVVTKASRQWDTDSIMFVYGNGKWHQVRSVEETVRVKVYKTCCGCTYHDDNNTSEEESIRESRYFCSRCGAKMSSIAENPPGQA